jgi:hypothetical protein
VRSRTYCPAVEFAVDAKRYGNGGLVGAPLQGHTAEYAHFRAVVSVGAGVEVELEGVFNGVSEADILPADIVELLYFARTECAVIYARVIDRS